MYVILAGNKQALVLLLESCCFLYKKNAYIYRENVLGEKVFTLYHKN